MIRDNKITKYTLFLLGSVFLLGSSSCSESSTQPVESAYITFPSHFPKPLYSNEQNALTEDKVALGKMLFFDPILSKDSSISCGSCHQIAYAMSDRNKKLSTGVESKMGTRNSPALFNLAWHKDFMWDGGVNHLEFVPLAPIENPLEMDLEFTEAIRRVNEDTYYSTEFRRLFGKEEISDREFLYALAQFMSAMISAESKYDAVKLGITQFTTQEQQGYELYKTKCASCHVEPLFARPGFENNGIDSTFADPGRMRITTLPADIGKFKIPSLRNLKYTFPYMHDGRFQSLEEVVNHYSTGIESSGASPADVSNMNFTSIQKEQLLAFLNTLNDENFVKNPLFQE